MYCIKIRFESYKRLAHTSCNTDSRILAFVGSNECGKSSMLEGLAWLTNGEDDALPTVYENRGREVAEDSVVVEAIFELTPNDLELLDDLDLAERPRTFTYQKWKNGTIATGANPTPRRNSAPFEQAAVKVASAQRKSHAQFAMNVNDSDEDTDTFNDVADRVLSALRDPDTAWSAEVVSQAELLAEWLSQPSTTGRTDRPRDEVAARLLRTALGKTQGDHPRNIVRQRLNERVPKFVLFGDQDRVLSTVHQISDQAVRSSPQPALANLLRIARIDLEKLWRFVETNDDSNRETLIDQANENLEDFFGQAWNQSHVSVRLKASGQQLEVYLKELGRGGPTTNIEERSDGLRTFVALSAFLASQELDVPPILLIDEAETHLHYDAQADLVGVLLKQIDASQVFYTTHSPGCLPGDLGTGIRLLRRDTDKPHASVIRQDFWTNEEPGFAPLLYAMGASAAAFSACRWAVLAEGAADMILIPTLLRIANDVADLDYQVAPGLANANAFGMRVEEVAAKVVYLLDGDEGGDEYRKQLLNAGVDEARIFALPAGWASEDLIDRHHFAGIASSLLPVGVTVSEDDLRAGQPIVKSLEDWGKRSGIKVPGHVAIAYGLVNEARELAFSPGAKDVLVKLHQNIMKAFS